MKTTGKKVYQIGFVVLVLINAILIFLLVRQSQGPPRNRESRNASIIEKVSSRLELTEDQTTAYQLMAKRHGEQMRTLESDHRALLRSYFETLNNDSTNFDEGIKKEILKIESEKLQYTYEHFEELKSMLTEQQKGQFEFIIKDILAVLIGERRRSRPPRRD